MRRAAWVFLAAILLPCLVLAWLAVRSEQDQQVILQHQQAIIDQGVADSLAQNVRTQMDAITSDFVQTARQLLATAGSPAKLADGFHQKIRDAWPLAQVGFAVDLQGTIYAPGRSDGLPAQTFRKENGSFLSNRAGAEVYSNVQNQLEQLVPENQAMTSTTPVANSSSSAALMSELSPLSLISTNAPHASPELAGYVDMASSQSLPGASSTAPTLMADLDLSAAPSVDQQKKGAAAHSAPKDLLEKAQLRNQDNLRNTDTSSIQPKSAFRSVTSPSALPRAEPASDTHPLATETSLPTAAAAAPKIALKTDSGFTAGAGQSPMPIPNALAPAAAPATSTAAAQSTTRRPFVRAQRQVAPQENTRAPDAVLSNVVPAESDFRQLIGQSTSGSVARFLEDKLTLLVWSLPTPAHNSIVFGAQLNQDRLVDRLRTLVRPDANRSSLDSSFGGRADYCLALLDDKGQPVAQSQPGFTTDWKHPFVATEIGSVLPHWEAALYLTDPHQVSRSARLLHLTIGLIILLLIVAILAGGTLIGADVGRQMRLAQQKTDFVSNVSHELKTPLTSIRMFADLLAEGRVEEPDKQATYLRIISAESARLTRLINNVLDFARLERGAPSGERHACDLVEVAREVVGTCQPHLESAKITLAFEVETESLPLMGDRDALSQIILNLISNAEKYGGGEIVVRARRQETSAGPMGCVDVFDRGSGIPPKQVEAIFTPFQRLDDSLASGIPGSGLGLTLARRMARAHGGDVTYQPRAGGGSCFTLTLPLSPANSTS